MSNEIVKQNYAIHVLRIVACIFIVWNHTSNFLLNGFFNKLSWANIGVQIFFFLSGYLYSGKHIEYPKQWIKRNFLKIVRPYWIYLLLVIPVIAIWDVKKLSVVKVVGSFLCIQGFGSIFSIEGL